MRFLRANAVKYQIDPNHVGAFGASAGGHLVALLGTSAGEKSLEGGMLETKYGKGTYVFTGYAFFRQLPAGVPGAYRLFANLASAGKAAPPPPRPRRKSTP